MVKTFQSTQAVLCFLTFVLVFAKVDAQNLEIEPDETFQTSDVVQDVVCNHATLQIQHEIQGKVLAVGCHLIFKQGVVLVQGGVIVGGTSTFEGDVLIQNELVQTGGVFSGGQIDNFKYVTLHDKIVERISQTAKSYLTSVRIVPEDIEHLLRTHKELLLHYPKQQRGALELLQLSQVASFELDKSQVRFAQKWQYLVEGKPVQLQFTQFKSQESAKQFWNVLKALTPSNADVVLQNDLGDGSHRFLKIKQESSLVWIQQQWVVTMFSSQGENTLKLLLQTLKQLMKNNA